MDLRIGNFKPTQTLGIEQQLAKFQVQTRIITGKAQTEALRIFTGTKERATVAFKEAQSFVSAHKNVLIPVAAATIVGVLAYKAGSYMNQPQAPVVNPDAQGVCYDECVSYAPPAVVKEITIFNTIVKETDVCFDQPITYLDPRIEELETTVKGLTKDLENSIINERQSYSASKHCRNTLLKECETKLKQALFAAKGLQPVNTKYSPLVK